LDHGIGEPGLQRLYLCHRELTWFQSWVLSRWTPFWSYSTTRPLLLVAAMWRLLRFW